MYLAVYSYEVLQFATMFGESPNIFLSRWLTPVHLWIPNPSTNDVIQISSQAMRETAYKLAYYMHPANFRIQTRMKNELNYKGVLNEW